MFQTVKHRERRVIIVCSGLSAKGFTPPEGVAVIAVNGAIDWLERADYFFTLDPSAVNIARINKKRSGVKYYAAFNKPIPGAITLKRIESPRMGGGRYDGVAGLASDLGEVNTGNSAYGALNLAVHMGAEKIVFIGLDGGGSRVEGGRSCCLEHLPRLFDTVADSVKARVINASPHSLICCFEKMNIDEALKWITA